MSKMKISNKILLTYFILLIAVFVVTGITFKVLYQRYLISEARSLLKIEAQSIANTLEKIPILQKNLDSSITAKREMRIAGQFIDSKIIILDKTRRVMYTNLSEVDRKQLQPLITNNNLNSKGYVNERVPIHTKQGAISGYVLLFTKIQDLNRISSVINRTQLMSLLLGVIIAIILAMIFQRGLTKPIQKLKYSMTNFSIKATQPELMIKTGDEIEELAECFSDMVEKLKGYDVQQKRFLQNTSHELKTPLMSIQGYAEAIKDGVVEGKEMEESLDVIIDESKRLKRIIDEMIYLIKLDNVDETFHFEHINIHEIIHNAIKSVKALADSKGISIKVEGNCSYTGVFDREKLTSAFINILGNGTRYAKKEIAITGKINNNFIEIAIRDDGVGFQYQEENKIFERFYKGEQGSTGIGLAITKAIINGHNGQIEAYNSIPTGAIFKITLPQI